MNFHLDIKSYSYITAVITSKTNKSKEKNKEMNSKIVTVKDVLESAEEYGKDGVLVYDLDKVRDLRKIRNDRKSNDCTWVPFKFKFVDGSESRLVLKFTQVVTASGSRLPTIIGEGGPKNMIIIFKEMSETEIAAGDNVPKEKSSPEEQAIENKRVEKLVNRLVESTNDFNHVLDIIDQSYRKLCSDLAIKKDVGFTIRKNSNFKTNKDVPVNSIVQRTRANEKNPDEPISLDKPLTRIKLSLAPNGDLAIKTNYIKDLKKWEYKPNVYNTRKSTSKNDYASVLARVKDNGKLRILNKDNANAFITYNSVVDGTIVFKDISVSNFGFALSNEFGELYVKRNTKAGQYDPFTIEDRKAIAGDTDEDEDDVEVTNGKVVDDISKDIDTLDLEDESDLDKKKKSKKVKSVAKPVVKDVKKKKTKSEPVVEEEDDDDNEDNDDDYVENKDDADDVSSTLSE